MRRVVHCNPFPRFVFGYTDREIEQMARANAATIAALNRQDRDRNAKQRVKGNIKRRVKAKRPVYRGK